MTMRDTPGGPGDPSDPMNRRADAAGCVWWWWVVAIIAVLLILWWIFAWTRPAYRVPPPTVPEEGALLPVEPVVDGYELTLTAGAWLSEQTPAR